MLQIDWNDMTQNKHKLGRIDGLDFARFLAFLGMVLVNFKIVMLPSNAPLGNASWLFDLLEGRAAALFVILAGIGLGLSVKIAQLNHKMGTGDFTIITIKRGLFLFVIGMLNAIIFSADILHYYGIYFLFAAFLAPMSQRVLQYVIVFLLALAPIMLISLDFDAGWDWKNYEYEGFFTIDGALRNLFYNGWHPVIPWLGFLLFGVLLSRINLTSRQVQIKMIIGGLFITLIGYYLSSILIQTTFNSTNEDWLELIFIFAMGPVPATFLYMITASATACAIIAASIILTKKLAKLSLIKAINIAGRQTLSLYIAHIYLGMGIMELTGMLGHTSISTSILTSLLFVILMAIMSNIWANFFKAGPLEMLMRKITG